MLPLISAFIFISASCKRNYFIDEGGTWGTYYRIVYGADRPLTDSIQHELRSIDEEFSLFNTKSLVSRINSGLTDTVSSRFIEVFDLCKAVNSFSEGVYDITVGTVANLWGFGKENVHERPTDTAIDSALQSVGLSDCYISAGRVIKKNPDTVFDFSSVAKGYGIDMIADMFERNGCHDYMIEIGGEVAVCGHNPQGRKWSIQIDSPESGVGHEPLSVVALGPQRTALASSGDYRNFVNFGDSIYGHTISPLTGYPVMGDILSATVRMSSCAMADALATACMAAGSPEDAKIILEKASASALIVYKDDMNGIRLFNKDFGEK